jgi:hypothetical protein
MARYDAFVLRVWRSGTGDDEQWAGRLEHLPDGITCRFGSLAALLTYLGAELAGESTTRHGSPADGPHVDAGKEQGSDEGRAQHPQH